MASLVSYVDGQAVADFVGRGSDTDFVQGMAQTAADLAIGAASSYTRGNGFDDFEALMPASLYTAVLLRAVRIVGNAQQLITQQTDGVTMTYGAAGQGFTIGELTALNEYRRMTASI